MVSQHGGPWSRNMEVNGLKSMEVNGPPNHHLISDRLRNGPTHTDVVKRWVNGLSGTMEVNGVSGIMEVNGLESMEVHVLAR
jgi:hypothetical protein